MAVNATGFTSALASVKYPSVNLPAQLGSVVDAVSNTSRWTVFFTLLGLAVAYDQFSYISKKGSIAGTSWKAPFLGPFLSSMDPKFEEYQAKWATGPLSCVSVFHKFVVIAASRDMARKVFNAGTYAKPCMTDVAHKFLGPDNWVFLGGQAHAEYRKGLNNMFTRKSLDIYLPGQEEVFNRHLKKFAKVTADAGGKPVPFMPMFREVMCATACRTFVGHYISEEAVQKITNQFYLITAALELVNFPIIIPYTKAWYGKKASDMILHEFSRCVAKSKARMEAGGEATCIMDAWIQQMIQSRRWNEAQATGVVDPEIEKPTVLVREFSDRQIAQTLFTFLFASQDATTSAVTWLFQVLAQRPEILDRVREENLKVRNGDVHAPVNLDQLESMAYTRAVIRELLRWRPPVLMVPYQVEKPFPISETYTIPKGSMVVATTYPALRDPKVYDRPDEFDPERYYTGDAEEKGQRNFLVFGTGPHYCLGQHYAQLNMALLIGKASLLVDWKHHATPKSEQIKIFATVYPMDDCPLTFTERT